MSGAKGGSIEVAGLALAAPIVVAVGLGVGAAVLGEAILRDVATTVAESARLTELRRQLAAMDRRRYEEYLRARTELLEAIALSAGDEAASGVGAADAAAGAAAEASGVVAAGGVGAADGVELLPPETETGILQQATGAQLVEAARLRRCHALAAERRVAQQSTTALGDVEDSQHPARRAEDDLRRLLEAQQEAALAAAEDKQLARATTDAQIAEARRRDGEESAAAVVAALAGCESATAQELRHRANAVLAGTQPWDEQLRTQTRVELLRVGRAVDDLIAAEVLADALSKLGYELGADFLTKVPTAGGAVARKAQWPNHALRLSVDGDTDRIAFEVVRSGDPNPASASEVVRSCDPGDRGTDAEQRREDVAVETEFCADLPAIIAAAEDDGVTIAIDVLSEPGAEEMAREEIPDFDAVEASAAGRRRRAADKDRERKLP